MKNLSALRNELISKGTSERSPGNMMKERKMQIQLMKKGRKEGEGGEKGNKRKNAKESYQEKE